MLSTLTRRLTYLTSACYTLLGVLLYIMPESLAPVFAWKVTPFITMTIGVYLIVGISLFFTLLQMGTGESK